MRTKIVWTCALIVLCAVLVCNITVWNVCKNIYIKDALQSASVESAEIIEDYIRFSDSVNVSRSDVQNYFKLTGDDLTICVKDGEVYFNNTVLEPALLATEESELYSQDLPLYYFSYKAVGRELAVFFYRSFSGTELYHVADISYAYDKLYMLALGMTAVSVATVIFSVAVMSFVLRSALKPLGKLSETARSIAGGSYEKRAEIDTNDEIGELAKNFNMMADAVEKHTAELCESEKKKTLFMGNLTHELKTPLTAISGYAQTLRSVNLSPEDEEEALTYIYREACRLDRLSKKMMRLLALENETELSCEVIQAERLLVSAVRTCLALAAEKNIILEIGDCEGTVTGDFDLLCDVVINLIDNAVKASDENSAVSLYTENGNITVDDNGCGIPEEDQAKILEPFYMVDKSRSRKSGGAGLGLALTALILKHHNMALKIESTVGVGTKMTIYNLFK